MVNIKPAAAEIRLGKKRRRRRKKLQGKNIMARAATATRKSFTQGYNKHFVAGSTYLLFLHLADLVFPLSYSAKKTSSSRDLEL